MKKHLLILSLLLSLISYAQNDRFAYAITDLTRDGISWSCLRSIDLQTGTYSDVLLQGNNMETPAFDAATRKQLTEPLTDARYGRIAQAPFATGVAAIAYDKKHQRLFYTPMFIDQLRYVDLKTNKVYFVNNQELTGPVQKASDQSNIITRMTIAADGYGYALTNDGNRLLRFSTGKNITITDLGALADDPANKDISIHNSCTSFGGDMIAGDDGQLYIFTARNHVFKADPGTKLATHLGVINGLPASFSINGAAVTGTKEILVSSAVDNSNLYVINSDGWVAKAAHAGPWRTSDLGNGNLLAVKPTANPTPLSFLKEEAPDSRIQIYPNPVTQKSLTTRLYLDQGRYTLQILDIAGKQCVQSVIQLDHAGQASTIQLPAQTKPGVYLVKVLNPTGKSVVSQKLVVE